MPALKERNRDEDDNGLPAVADLDLRILVSAKLPSAHRLFGFKVDCMCAYVCVSDGFEIRERIDGRSVGEVMVHLTSRAETNCRGRSELLMSETLFWRSSRALLMATSTSEGELRDGLFGAIFESCDILAASMVECVLERSSRREIVWALCEWQ